MVVPAVLFGWIAPASAAPVPLGDVWIPAEATRNPSLRAIAGAGWGEDERIGPDGRRWVRLVVEPGAVEALIRAGIEVDAPRADARLRAVPDGYHDPDAVESELDALEARVVRGGRVAFGASRDGRPITGLWLGQEPGNGAPVVRILAGHHGDEPTSVEVALAVAARLVDGDGVDPAITATLDRSTVWIVPDVNPDGHAAGTRTNAAGVDLNRNYAYEWSASAVRPGDAPFSEPETRAIRAFGIAERPFVSLTLHAGATNLGWPWNYTTDDPVDAPILRGLSRQYAAACTAPGFWITQGADWYPTTGDTNDWAYGRYGTFDLTLELSAKIPTDLGEVLGWHVDAILAFAATAPTVSGVVVDAGTGAPVEARVRFADDGRWVPTDPVTGAFHQLAAAPGGSPGTAWVEAWGYTPVEVALDGAVARGPEPVGGPLRIALDRDTLATPDLSPSVLWEPTAVAFGRDGAASLVRADADPVPVSIVGGEAWLDPAALDPGWWTVAFDDGVVWPRALFVEDADGLVVRGFSRSGSAVTLDVDGLSAGRRAWAVWGPDRTVTPLTVTDDGVELGAIPVDPAGPPVVVTMWTGSAWLGFDDVADPRDRVSAADPPDEEPAGCGCSGTGGAGRGRMVVVWAGAAVLGLRRRRTW
ncbi:MAG: M14 family zinc carboxypeptidase [Myxococcota bacterium]